MSIQVDLAGQRSTQDRLDSSQVPDQANDEIWHATVSIQDLVQMEISEKHLAFPAVPVRESTSSGHSDCLSKAHRWITDRRLELGGLHDN